MNKTTFQIYGLKKTKYYGFIPSSSYILGQVNKTTYGYFYGYFTGYTETGVVTTKKHLIKLNSNLTIDNSFDIGTGFDQILYLGSSILEQPDGKLIVTGTFSTYRGETAMKIVRLNTDGSNDYTMGSFGGGATNYTQVPALQSDGKIIVTGGFSSYNDTYGDHSGFGLARLNVDGTYDNTLSVGSGFNQPTMSAVSNDDLSMIITGYFDSYKGVSCPGGIVKLDQYGNKDTSFISGTGFNIYGGPNPNYLIKLPGESSIYVSGRFTSYNGVAASRIIKIKQNGSIDTSFNSGTGFNGSTYPIQVIWTNKLFITGNFTSYNGTPAQYSIILNLDGSILWSSSIRYYDSIVIGNTLFGQQLTKGRLIGLFNYVN